MSQTNNSFYSLIKCKCPQCHEGNLFVNERVYQYKGFLDMPTHCPKCGLDYEPETGFYLGATFVSYAVTVALNVAVFVALLVFQIYSLNLFLICAAIALIVTFPYVIKFSRSIWIAMTVRYDPKAIEKYEQKT